jgi:hypothetical protein
MMVWPCAWIRLGQIGKEKETKREKAKKKNETKAQCT